MNSTRVQIPVRRIRLLGFVIAALFVSLVAAPPPALAASTLGPDEDLASGQTLWSSNGYALTMQADGNLVAFAPGTRPQWSSQTNARENEGAIARMQADGNLVVIAPGNRPVWQSGTAGRGRSTLVVQDDGNVVIHGPSGATWSWKTGVITSPPPPPPPTTTTTLPPPPPPSTTPTTTTPPMEPAEAVSPATPPATAAGPAGGVYSWGAFPLLTGRLFCAVGVASSPKPIGITGVVAIAKGSGANYALTTAGTVLSWGTSVNDGSLGTGGASGVVCPAAAAMIPGLTGVTGIAAGPYSGYAVRADGTLWAWGRNRDGQLGDGTLINRPTPVQVHGITTATSVVAGGSTAYVVLRDGTVRAWGRGVDGQLGNGRRLSSTTAQQVTALAHVTSMAAGKNTAYALRSDGTVWAWGDGLQGKLGSTSRRSTIPLQVRRLGGIAQLAASAQEGRSAFALRGDGTVWAWGSGQSGQLGYGATADRSAPTQVTGLDNVVTIGAGGPNGFATDRSGTSWSWGAGADGSLGNGTDNRNSNVPVPMSISRVAQFAGGFLSHNALVSAAIPSAPGSPADGQAPGEECADGIGGTDQWAFHAFVSDDDGLVLDLARLGPRVAVRDIRAPSFNVTLADGTSLTGELTATPSSSPGRPLSAQLISFDCTDTAAQATYAVVGLPANTDLEITQRYEFAARVPGDRCEPSGKVPCARFWPNLQWRITRQDPTAATRVLGVGTVQRLDLAPDGRAPGSAEIGRDRFKLLRKNPNVETLDLDREAQVLAIYPGIKPSDESKQCRPVDRVKKPCTFGNLHESGGKATLVGLDGKAGCPDCVHFHWRWSESTNLLSRNFTSGAPAVMNGSPQTANIAVVAEHPEEADAQDASKLVNGEKVAGRQPIVYWTSFSPGLIDPDGTRRDATFPVLKSYKPGDRASMWFATAADTARPTRYSCKATIKWSKPIKQQSALHERLPAGYVLPVAIKPQCHNDNSDGPFYLSVSGGDLLNAAGSYQRSPYGTPYIEVRKDNYNKAKGTFSAGSQLRSKRTTLHAYAVFATKPSKQSVHLQLLVAPSNKTGTDEAPLPTPRSSR